MDSEHTHLQNTQLENTQLERRIRRAWGPDTCFSLDLWDPELPETGQCGTTALVVAELLGGDILEAPVYRNGEQIEYHYWTRLASGEEIDWTRAQFQDDRVIGEPEVKERPPVLKEPFQEMYEILLNRVLEGRAFEPVVPEDRVLDGAAG